MNPRAWQVLHVLISLVVVGCGGGRDATVAQPTTESINGISVPPAPDPETNRSTVAGVDANGNGIRDDIDRLLATNFGAEPTLLTLATAHARRLQDVLVTQAPAARVAYVEEVRCLRDSLVLDRLAAQTRATLDTQLRQRAYATTLAGATATTEGC